MCLIVLINATCSFVYFHELKVELVSTIPDFNIDTRKTFGLFVALFGLNLNGTNQQLKMLLDVPQDVFKLHTDTKTD